MKQSTKKTALSILQQKLSATKKRLEKPIDVIKDYKSNVSDGTDGLIILTEKCIEISRCIAYLESGRIYL